MKKRIAVVTGASRGIGAAIADVLAEDGFTVVVNYSGDQASANAVVDGIQSKGGMAVAIKADIGKSQEVVALFDQVEREFGGVDVLVNNAGIAIRKSLADFSEDDFDAVVATNLKGTFLTLKEASKRMRDHGRIVNISASFQGAPIVGYGPYAASKMAVEKLTEVAAKELGARGITVNAVRPGPTKTPLFSKGKTAEVQDQFAKQAALGRLGQPDDIAAVVRFLVSDEGGWVSGQAIGANGGYWS
jgi:3-oxoacyl-[acyl-carrier protein] reductase